MSRKNKKAWKSPVKPAAVYALVTLFYLCDNANLSKHSHPLIKQIHNELMRLEHLLMKKKGAAK